MRKGWRLAKACSYVFVTTGWQKKEGKTRSMTETTFLDAFSHLYKRVCLSVSRSHTSWISEKWADFKQSSIRIKKVCHFNLKTIQRQVRGQFARERICFAAWTPLTCFFFFHVFLADTTSAGLLYTPRDHPRQDGNWAIATYPHGGQSSFPCSWTGRCWGAIQVRFCKRD